MTVLAVLLGGALVLAVVDAVAIAVTLPLPAAGVGLRAAHHLFDAAETLGLGALAAFVCAAVLRWLRPPRWVAAMAAVAATSVFVALAIGENLARVVSLLTGGRLDTALAVASVPCVASLLVGAAWAAQKSTARPRLWALPLLLAVVALVGDYFPIPDDYQGIHGVVAWGAAMMAGGAISPWVERALRWAASSGKGRVALAGGLVFSLAGLVVSPPNAVRYELFRPTCAVAPWVLATTRWGRPQPHAPASPPASPWSHDRSGEPPVAPTSPRLLPQDSVVVLLTVDAMRADALADPANDALFPTFAAMRREGVFFTHASAPSSQTALSLGTMFSGRTFSEQLWTEYGKGETRFLYPAEDPSVRFPELLGRGGVATASHAGAVFLTGDFGIARGFAEDHISVKGRVHATADQLIRPMLYRANRTSGPLFLYAHLMEPHEPYDRGRRDGTPRERYLSEIAIVDTRVGQVIRHLEAHFPKRWALFVSADHGEAFGEHGTTGHAKTLYEELLHVPLFAESPLFPPRVVEQPVGLVDLGPTILDLFGQETPASFLGQSLVPILAGGEATLTRPLVAEGRLRRALRLPDGTKVIDDQRRKIVEVYDLAADPGETRNLFDVDTARSDAALVALRAFFAGHTRTAGGYDVPFKP